VYKSNRQPDGVKSSPTPGKSKNRPSVPYAVLSRPILADRRLHPSDKLVLLALQQWGWQSHCCFPGNGKIREAAGLSECSVRRSLANLEELKLIRIDPTRSNPTGRVIVLLWMDDPELHPHEVPLGSQNDTLSSLGSQNDSALRVSKRRGALGCQNETLINSS
jgi:hypothetical protein